VRIIDIAVGVDHHVAVEGERFADGSRHSPAHGILAAASQCGASSKTDLEARGLRGEAVHGEREGDQLAIRVVVAPIGQELQLGIRSFGLLAIVDAGNEEVGLRARQWRVEGAAHAEVAVAHREDTLHFVLARRVEALLLDLPGSDALVLVAQMRVEIGDGELAEVGDHKVGAVGCQRRAVAAAIDTDHEAEGAAAAGLDARYGVLDDERAARGHPESLRSLQEGGRARLAVHVGKIVRLRIERLEGLPALHRTPAQEVIEQLLPRLGVQLRSAGHDAVHVEEHRVEAEGGRSPA
jgi:hypothetical protein